MKYSIVTFADAKYQERQFNLLNYASNLKIFDQISFYTDEWLKKTDFYKENLEIFKISRGFGTWLWKPFIILETLKNMDDGDSLFYLDCGDYFRKEIIDYTKPILTKEPCLLLGGGYSQKDWTKRDCFYYMNCDFPEYADTIQLEAGVQLWKKTEFSIKVLEEQIEWCKDYRILTDAPNECGMPNYLGFQDHRHDQSVLTNLFVKYKLPVDSTKHNTPYNEMRSYVRCNVF